MKAKIAGVKDLGMQVNRLDTNELVDHCILVFENEAGETYNTYAMTKTCHGKSKLGKLIRAIIGRNLGPSDFNDDCFDSSSLIGAEVYIELNEYKVVTKVSDIPIW